MKNYNWLLVVGILIGFPLLFWAVGDLPRRSVLKELISLLTIISFAMMVGQFYLTRGNRKVLKVKTVSKLIRWHKIVGYVFTGFLLLHPFFIVVPRFFEAGVEPLDAFTTLITTYNSTGVILGISAWFLMLIIGLTSYFRDHLPLTYTSWRLLHGILSILFITLASWHAIDLGRHTDIPMSVFIIIVSGIGILLLLRTYFNKQHNEIG